MAENSKIEWTDHTFNPWIGCTKVSPGCDHCYAENLSKRYGWVKWGPHGERKRTSEANWRKPRQWAKAARGTGKRPRVFCASLADVFDNKVPVQWRTDLFDLIAATPELDWLLLTKRPENVARMFPTGWWGQIWLGTTCEDQEHYLKRFRLISEVAVPIRFISYEPALGPLAINLAVPPVRAPDWIICGGESGHGARMMEPWWARNVMLDCERYGIAFFMKQMTGKKPIPDDLLIRQFPAPVRPQERPHD
jgi:protein gp37